MSLANRFLYIAGREMSEAGRIHTFQSPAKSPYIQDKTGPFQTRPTKAQTGFVEWGDMTFDIWGDSDLESFLDKLQGSSSTVNTFDVIWGDDTDAVSSKCYAGRMIRLSATPRNDPSEITEWNVTLTPDEYGFHEVKSLRAMATMTGDGNTESTSDNNGTMASAVSITSSSVANPTVITAAAAHGLTTGDTVLIASHSGSTPDINGSHTVTVLTATTFTIAVNVTVGGTGGTLTRTSSRNGGVCYVQLSANAPDTATGLSFILRHSPDNATFADKGTFTTITTAVSSSDPADGYDARLVVTGVIDRYAAIKWDYTGTAGSAAGRFAAFLQRGEVA